MGDFFYLPIPSLSDSPLYSPTLHKKTYFHSSMPFSELDQKIPLIYKGLISFRIKTLSQLFPQIQ